MRHFPRKIKRAALTRSGGLCEAAGAFYGLYPNERCNAPLSHGVEFDHVLAFSNGGDSTLENCVAVCKRCHSFKTARHDTPRAAKTKRQSDKAKGIRNTTRGFRGWRKFNNEIVWRD